MSVIIDGAWAEATRQRASPDSGMPMLKHRRLACERRTGDRQTKLQMQKSRKETYQDLAAERSFGVDVRFAAAAAEASDMADKEGVDDDRLTTRSGPKRASAAMEGVIFWEF